MAVKKRVQEPEKMRLNISEDMAKILVDYSLSYVPSSLNLSNFLKLLNLIDIESYRYNYEIYNRLYLARLICETRVNEGVTMPAIIRERVLERDPTLTDVCQAVTWQNDTLKGSDAASVTKYVDKKIQFYCYYLEMPEIVKLWDTAMKCKFETAEEILYQINKRISNLVHTVEASTAGPGLVTRLNFADPDIGNKIENIAKFEQSPKSVLQTGIRQLNANLGPGFRGGKFYVFLGPSGKFKSGTLLNMADQIRQFNPQLEELTPDGKRNTLLFITAENTINETIERLYSMHAAVDAPFLSTDPSVIKDTLLNDGRYAIRDDGRGIDIEIRYFDYLEIDTNDIRNIIKEMNDNGQNVIGLILDYIKRINCVAKVPNGDEVLRVGAVAKELRSIAQAFGIPVISAQQVNRTGNAILDSAMRDGKSDLLRFVGNSDIGSAWSVVEEADVVIFINLERRIKDKKLFLTFKFTKKRYKAGGSESVSDYFNHPFTNEAEIKLLTDLDKEAAVSVLSLASDLETVSTDELEEYTQRRPIVVKREGHADAGSILNSIGIKDGLVA